MLCQNRVSLGDGVFPGFQIGFPWEMICLLRLPWCLKLIPCPRSCWRTEFSHQYRLNLNDYWPSQLGRPSSSKMAPCSEILVGLGEVGSLGLCSFCPGQGNPVWLTLSMVSRVFTGLYLSQLWHSNKRLEIMNASLYFCSTVPLFFSV